jgi:hypothetical protein
MAKKQPPLTRRETLRWLMALGGGGLAGLCGTSALFAALLGRRIRYHQGIAATLTAQPINVPTVAAPNTPQPPPIINRAGWNAAPVNPQASDEFGQASTSNPNGWYLYPGNLADAYHTVAVHHSFLKVGDTDSTMAEIQAYHFSRGWADIAYHFGVDKNGVIYEGRAIAARGASVAGFNTGLIGVVGIGDFENTAPPLAMLEAMQTLIFWLRDAYGLSHIVGHRDFNTDTLCPGRYLYPHIDTIAANTGLAHSTAGYQGPPALPTPVSWLGCPCAGCDLISPSFSGRVRLLNRSSL